jgi:RNA polymerase sigma factor (sigma-70 family)
MDEFTALYDRHYQDVYRFALFLSSDPTRAEDLAAETFVRAWLARDRIRQPTVRAYLLTITRNLYRDGLRARRDVALEQDVPQTSEPGADIHAQHRAELQQVLGAVRQLAPGDRRALLLRAVRDMSYADIALHLGVPVGSVKSRISRARHALRLSTSTTTPDPARKDHP